jgi:hypothetical protein
MKNTFTFYSPFLQAVAKSARPFISMRMEAEKLKWLNSVMNTVTCRLQGLIIPKKKSTTHPTLLASSFKYNDFF